MAMMILPRQRNWTVLLLILAITAGTTPFFGISYSCCCCFAAPLDDRIESLPLFGPPPTPHYSGYLDATDGCNTKVNGAYCKVHYWLCTAEEDDDDHDHDADAATNNKPVVLWLNGGPGASSIIGLLQENGPLLTNATGGLMVNPYSWTNVANLLVLESPVGVGFSFCEAQVNGSGVCENTDTFTASATRAALVDFFQKFPEFANRDFFLTGESYAGVYLPTLAYEILQYNNKITAATTTTTTTNTNNPIINLQGMAVGDPCTDNTAQHESMDVLWYSHKYGLVDDAVYDTLRRECHVRSMPNFLTEASAAAGGTADHDDDDDHYQSRSSSSSFMEWMAATTATRTATEQDSTTTMTESCTLAMRKYMLSSSRGIAGKWTDHFIDRYSLFAPVTDIVDLQMEAYMNRADVKVALHVQDAPVDRWTMHAPVDRFDYTKEFDACNRYYSTSSTTTTEGIAQQSRSMIDFYRKVAPKLRATWIYNGDADPAVSYEGTRTAVKRIGFPEVDGGGYRPWFYNHTATTLAVLREKPVMFGPDLLLQGTGAQFGGEVVNYEHGLAFLTMHGSGHMVPQFRPQAALHMITKLLAYHELSPLLPTNTTLVSMSNDEFYDTMDNWTESAKAAPYVGTDSN